MFFSISVLHVFTNVNIHYQGEKLWIYIQQLCLMDQNFSLKIYRYLQVFILMTIQSKKTFLLGS